MTRPRQPPPDRPRVYRRDPDDEAYIDRVIAAYQPRSPVPLTREDGREIVRNLAGAYGTLLKWRAKRLREQEAEDGTGDK